MGEVIKRGGQGFPEDWEKNLDPMAHRALTMALEEVLAKKLGEVDPEVQLKIENVLRNPKQKISELVNLIKELGIEDSDAVVRKAKELYLLWQRN